MKQLEPGRLYRVNRYFWYLFPTKHAAADPAIGCGRAQDDWAVASAWVSSWSKELCRPVYLLRKRDTIMVVQVSCEQVKVIDQEGRSGWINWPRDWPSLEGTITEVPHEP